MNFIEKLENIQKKNLSNVCVGLDPELLKIPEWFINQYVNSPKSAVLAYCEEVVKATAPFACAFKINSAFFEAQGGAGFTNMAELFNFIQAHYPEHIIIWDAKRGDIGNTAKQYAIAAFEKHNLNADAMTVSPYLGFDSISPYLDYKDKMIFVLCLTSNKGAEDFQMIPIQARAIVPLKNFLFHEVAGKIKEWGFEEQIGMVVGATQAAQLKSIRDIVGPKRVILIPGVGAQGGDLEATIKANNGGLFLINSSRVIIFASKEKDFSQAAAKAAMNLRDQINALKGC